ncbi:MAG TPA: hypothetical protein PLA21_06560 [Rectinema sp.]|nr:hypothetical protein [Rectinema sp.]
MPDAPKKSIAAQIVDLVLQAVDADTMDLWTSQDETPYLSWWKINHYEHFSLNSEKTKQHLGSYFHEKSGEMASGSALSDALTILSGYARKRKTYQIFLRVGKEKDAIYIDIGDATWQAIKITSQGWQIIDNAPIKFRRPKGMLPLPRPIQDGSIEDLRPLLNTDADSWILIKAWLLSLLMPVGPYPLLIFNGEQGTAKSYNQKVLKAIIDPAVLPIRRPPKTQEDLMIAANNNWIVSFDNLSKISCDLSDDLCNISTGGGIAKRALYSDGDESIITVCRPIMLNGITDFVTRPDLLDRSIVVTLPRIDDKHRQAEDILLAKFKELHPSILGSILDMAVIAMRESSSIKLEKPGRMAGFLAWAVAGLQDTTFLHLHASARTEAAASALEGDPLITQLKIFAQALKEPWIGSTSSLLQILNDQANYGRYPPRGWPTAANQLSNQLRRLAPILRSDGIDIQKYSNDPETRVSRWKIQTEG